jgi:hypothetical protein
MSEATFAETLAAKSARRLVVEYNLRSALNPQAIGGALRNFAFNYREEERSVALRPNDAVRAERGPLSRCRWCHR